MIFILSIASEPSTTEVVEWITNIGKNFVLITEVNKISELKIAKINNENIEIIIITNDGKIINFHEISSYWYRRGWLRFHVQYKVGHNIIDDNLKNEWDNTVRRRLFFAFVECIQTGCCL